jgi:hypothetical protein
MGRKDFYPISNQQSPITNHQSQLNKCARLVLWFKVELATKLKRIANGV